MNTPLPYMQGAEPYFHRGGPAGCLCLHGFTASPHELRWLSEHLAGAGFTVYTPRLTGHGTTPRDLARMRWHDWYADALDGYHLLRAQCERLFVVGHSMGGLLALLLAANMSLDGLAVLAAPIRLTRWDVRNARWLWRLRPYTDQTDRTSLPALIAQEQARRGETVTGRVRYNRWSTRAVAQLHAVSVAAYEALPRVAAPLLLIYSTADATVDAALADVIADRVASTDVQRHTLTKSDHILPQDVERETVFALTADFIRRRAGTPLA